MKIRSEEHRALRGLLPDDVRSGAVRLNVAARERGGESVITPARVAALGEGGVRKVVADSHGDPARAARLVAQHAGERIVNVARGDKDRGDGRER
jgi:hypothetical protein